MIFPLDEGGNKNFFKVTKEKLSRGKLFCFSFIANFLGELLSNKKKREMAFLFFTFFYLLYPME